MLKMEERKKPQKGLRKKKIRGYLLENVMYHIISLNKLKRNIFRIEIPTPDIVYIQL